MLAQGSCGRNVCVLKGLIAYKTQAPSEENAVVLFQDHIERARRMTWSSDMCLLPCRS